MIKINIPLLEYHLTNSCNLSCESCSHYSNIIKGQAKNPEELKEHLYEWSKLLDISEFHIMGGEPLLNKNIDEFCYITRKILPTKTISIFTNGLLIHKNQNILQALINNKIQIKLSIHSKSVEYANKLKPNLDIIHYWESMGIKIIKQNSITSWTKRYNTNTDGTISPFKDNNPDESWRICRAKYCANLVGDKIYKCPALAYLSYVKNSGRTTADFDPYLEYKPISYSQPFEEIKLFFENNSKPESFCSMCPSKKITIKNKSI